MLASSRNHVSIGGSGLNFGARHLHGGHITDNSLPLGFLTRNFGEANRAYLRNVFCSGERSTGRNENQTLWCQFLAADLVYAKPSCHTAGMVYMLAGKRHLQISSPVLHLANHTPVIQRKTLQVNFISIQEAVRSCCKQFHILIDCGKQRPSHCIKYILMCHKFLNMKIAEMKDYDLTFHGVFSSLKRNHTCTL